jgi:hypothetical protein
MYAETEPYPATLPVSFDNIQRRIGRLQCSIDPSVCPARTGRRSTLEEQIDRVRPSKQEHSLFCVMGQKLTGRATALIIAAVEADAEYFALHDLGFVTVAATTLVSESVYWNRD